MDKTKSFLKKLKLLKFVALLLVVMFGVSACMNLSGPRNIELTKENNGKTVEASVNDILNFKLQGNATTGYTWILKKYDENLLEFIDIKYNAPNSELMGAPGEWDAQFKVLKPGLSQIQFIYKRPWETKTEPLEKYSVNIDGKQLLEK